MRSVQCLLLLGLITLLFSAQANAMSKNLVIAHVQAGALTGLPDAASQEFVTIYNNSAHDVEVTNWCVTNKSGNTFACIEPTLSKQTLFLNAYGYMTMVSGAFSQQYPSHQADATFKSSSAIVASGDTISLIDANNVVVDTVGWTSANSLTGGTILQRRSAVDSPVLQDTDDASDFIRIKSLTLPISGIYEVITLIDECDNIPELQEEIPEGFLKDAEGKCKLDECSNLDGLQETIPGDYLRRDITECRFDYVALMITEILPNAAGNDTGHEYIELYNPTDRDAFLINYVLKVGSKTYTFPLGLKIGPGEYMAFYNNEMTFTFVNTTSFAMLLGDDGSIISQSDPYSNPKDDMAWALIDETWQYTNQMTFASLNIASIVEPEIDDEKGLSPCASNQYRHPETRRCRLLVTTASAVTPCKDGQYRSEETNRCRKIALAGDTLKPCKEHQYRSEDTNRCRNLVTAARTLKPCKDGQYRSEETNRCRKIPSAAVAPAAFAVEPIADTGTTFVGWWALGGIGAIALSYAVWEWRLEAISAVRKLLSFFTQR